MAYKYTVVTHAGHRVGAICNTQEEAEQLLIKFVEAEPLAGWMVDEVPEEDL